MLDEETIFYSFIFPFETERKTIRHTHTCTREIKGMTKIGKKRNNFLVELFFWFYLTQRVRHDAKTRHKPLTVHTTTDPWPTISVYSEVAVASLKKEFP